MNSQDTPEEDQPHGEAGEPHRSWYCCWLRPKTAEHDISK